MEQLDPFSLQSNLGKQPLDRVDTDLRAVVALRQMALSFGTSDHTAAARTAFDAVKQVLRVHLATAGNLPDQDSGAIYVPLPR